MFRSESNPFHPEAATTVASLDSLQARHDAWQRGYDEALEGLSVVHLDQSREYMEGRASRRDRVETVTARSEQIDRQPGREPYVVHTTYTLGDGTHVDHDEHFDKLRDAKAYLARLPETPRWPTWYEAGTRTIQVSFALTKH